MGTEVIVEHVYGDEAQEYIDTLSDGDKRLKWKELGGLGDADEMLIEGDGSVSMTTHSAPWLRKQWVMTTFFHPKEVLNG